MSANKYYNAKIMDRYKTIKFKINKYNWKIKIKIYLMKAVLILKSNSEMVGAKIKMIIKMNQNKNRYISNKTSEIQI